MNEHEDMKIEIGDTEDPHLSDEDIEENVKEIVLDEEQFSFVALTLRARMTEAVGEIMQTIEIVGLSQEQSRALKDRVKSALWRGVRDFIDAVGDVSEINSTIINEVKYNA